MTGDWKNFRFEVEGGVATLTFDRPEKLNALTFDVYADLRDLIGGLAHQDEIRVLVIAGEGKGFCSGGDVDEIIGELVKMDSKGLLGFTRMTGAVVQAMRSCPVPIVAAINGVAAGAGAVIALAADFRVFANSGTLSFLFTKVGLAGADMGSAYLLPRLVGLSKATELLMLGDTLDAEQATRLGLAVRWVEDDQLRDVTAALARRLAKGPTLAYAATKLLLTREQDMDLESAIELEATTQAMLMTSKDFQEFYAAFTEGRKPNWTGK